MSLQHWENYYRSGALATVPLGSDRSYTKELRDIWVEFFSGLPDGARILDIGTGNGAIALIAGEIAAASGRQYAIHGTDLAQIDPLRDVPGGARLFGGIQFHPGVATEHLPFEAASFDAVSGQYALEYTAIDTSLGEIHRVLKSGGRAQFVLHHAESIVALKARESLRHSALVLEDTIVFRKLRRHLEAERRPGPVARRTWADLAAAVAVLRSAASQSGNPLVLNVTLDAIQQLLSGRQGMSPTALDREVTRVEGDFRASVHRLRDILQYVQTEADMQAMAKLAIARDFEVSGLAAQHHAGQHLVGWRLSLVRC